MIGGLSNVTQLKSVKILRIRPGLLESKAHDLPTPSEDETGLGSSTTG